MLLSRVLCLLLFALVFSPGIAKACEPGFVDTLDIKIIDHKYRPIEGAAVNVTYQKDRTTGKGYVTTNTQYTGEDGRVEETIRNTETFESRVECGLTIRAEYDGAVVEREIQANDHANELQVRFGDAYLLSLKVVDRYGQPLANTQVRVNQMYRNTTESGYVNIIVNEGITEIAVPYKNGVITKEVEVTEDKTYTLQARVYPLHLEVVDDMGGPLDAEITVEDMEFESSEVDIEEIALQHPYVVVSYGMVERVPEINLAEQTEYIISFDITPPEITDVEVRREDGELRIFFYINDPNAYASGADLAETSISYTLEGITHTAIPYADSGGYVVDIPEPPENTLLRFTITAYDNEGNMNTVNGQYLITPEEEDGEENGEGEGDGGEEPLEESDNTCLLVGGALAAVIVVYLVWRYVKGLTEEE
ncbi:hypothetical protein GF415_02150 [Candidatus Micrarchaeota archaeon]|nr:hypothetical protein [Candidatus Micrarchaeota archaeon]